MPAVPPTGSFDVFLSHPHTDAAAVEALGVRLEADAGLKVWLDRWVLVPGDRWQQPMARGLDQARTCAVFLGGATPAGWFREEIERALSRQARDPAFRVIPVVLPGGQRSLVDDFLELRTCVEFRGGLGDPQALHLLICGVRGVAPGRPMPARHADSEQTQVLRARLSKLRDLRAERLIDDEVAIEFQRRLLDELVIPERP